MFLVDDDPAMLESMAFVLNQAGLKTVQFNDPKDCWFHRTRRKLAALSLIYRCPR